MKEHKMVYLHTPSSKPYAPYILKFSFYQAYRPELMLALRTSLEGGAPSWHTFGGMEKAVLELLGKLHVPLL